MTDHDDDVAAVLVEALVNYYDEKNGSEAFHAANRAAVAAQLAALAAAGIRCLYVPEGVEVEHGARLVGPYRTQGTLVFVIEDTP